MTKNAKWNIELQIQEKLNKSEGTTACNFMAAN